MKKNIHPKYHQNATVTCACGNTFKTGSVKSDIKVEICNQCHPFFTGKMKFIDTMGRVEKFEKQVSLAKTKKYIKKKDRKKQKAKNDANQPKTLKEMIQKQTSKKKS